MFVEIGLYSTKYRVFKLAEGLPSILRGKLEGLIQKLDYLLRVFLDGLV